jgi:hypothetical protein
MQKKHRREGEELPKETMEQKRHRMKVIDENKELVERARSGHRKSQLHLQALIDKTEVDPSWLEEDKEVVQQMILNNIPHFSTMVDVVGDCLKITMLDPNEYKVAIDFVKIKSIHRVSYNVSNNQLNLVFPETMGEIAEQAVPVYDAKGKETGGKKLQLGGKIQPFKIVITTEEVIKAFLDQWLSTDVNHESFGGFEAHAEQEIKMKEALEEAKKRIPLPQGNPPEATSKIVDMHGQVPNK